MAKMVNISDVTLRVKVSMMPGQEPMVTTLEPGEAGQFPDGYCAPVRSAGTEMLPSILSRANQHMGIPALVPEADAEAARDRYVRVKAAKEANSKDPQVVIRRLEAELAVAKAQVAGELKFEHSGPPASPPVPAHLEESAYGSGRTIDVDTGSDLAEATTPKPPKRQRKSRAKGAQG